MRALRHALFGTPALVALSLVGCADPATGILVEVSTDVRVPQDMDGLFVRVHREPDEALMARNYELGEPPKVRLPARLGLVSERFEEGPLTIEILGRSGQKLMVSRSVRLPFSRGAVREVPVVLSRECVGILCPGGRTCVPGRGCVSADLDGADEAPREPCDCGSFLPLCIGATWTYAETGENGLPGVKSWLIQDRGPLVGTPGKERVTAFVQFRKYAFGMARRWLSVGGDPGRARVSWEKDEFFDDGGRLTQTTLYVPNKLRLDESRTTIGERWNETYEEVDIRPGVPTAPALRADETWEVVAPEEQPNFPRLLFPNALCQRRRAREADGASGGQTYCFVRGVGKVYERTVGADEEILTSYVVPGCGRLGE